MGLLDALTQYIKDAAPGGLLNSELTPENIRTAGEYASMTPNPIGDIASGLLAADDLRKGNYGEAALNGLGLLPFVPAMGGVLKGADLKAEVLRQANEGWSKAIGDTGQFTLKQMYPVTIDINGNLMKFGASKASGAGPLSLTRLANTQYGPKFVHYKLSKDGDLIESGQQNLFAMTPDVRDEHVSHFNSLFGE